MCGIMGYTGGGAAAKIVYDGLKRLEYRGYDSAGISVLCGNEIKTVKRLGRVSALGGLLGKMHGGTGIGHTRWATHGKPSDENAHPHNAGVFSIVHNGIIENYSQLKAEYFSDENFLSDTDSEVIAKLLDKFYDGDLTSALARVCGLLRGSYAIAVMCAKSDGFAVAKRGSSVVIGYGENENFAASDLPALAGLCKNVAVLNDGDIALLTANDVAIFDENLQGVIREIVPNPATPADLELNGNPHYMLKEIREVPAAIERTRLSYAYVESSVKKAMEGVDRVIITGCGTAYNSGLAAKRYIESFARIPAEAEIAGEFRYKNPVITPNTAVIAVSQSGETADTVEAAELALSLGAKVIAVTNSPYSRLTRCADVVVPVEAGCEICVAATKSYSGQITALYMIARTLAGSSVQSSAEIIAPFPALCAQITESEDIDGLADMCARSYGTYFLGRDIDYAVAQEGSLKLKEISYVPSEGYPAGELKHGTLALIDIRTVSVFIITGKSLAGKCSNAVEQVLSRKGKAAVITNVAEVAERFKGRAYVVEIPSCDEWLSPLVSSVVLQLLAYKTALLLDRDPDKPRNLAKSVTVE